MEMPDILKSKSVKGFIKGSLVLIGLFAVLYCGSAVFLLHFEDKIDYKIFILFLILAIIPLIIFFFVFLKISFFVRSYYKKLYGSSDNEGAYIKIQGLELEKLKEQNHEKHELEINKLKEQNCEKDKIQEMEMMIEICQMVVKAINPDSGKNGDILHNLLKEILIILSKMTLKEKSSPSDYFNDRGGI